jgi:hypothetical protein
MVSFHPCASEEFGDLGDYGVSERFMAVHPIGYPIFHSTKAGFGRHPSAG